jgi:glucosamine--fructose-6-phosphate aminotransferase (isomerizing)
MSKFASLQQPLLNIEDAQVAAANNNHNNIPTYTLNEILSQTTAWQASLAEVESKQELLKTLWQKNYFSEVIVTGCGSPYYLALSIAPLLQQLLGRRCRAVPASELLLFPDTILPATGKTLLLVLSRSGKTTETVQAVQLFKARLGTATLSVSCYPNTPLLAESSLSLVATEGQEQSVVQTRSFSSMAIMAQALVNLLTGDAARFQAMQTLPSIGDRIIANYHKPAKQLGENSQFERFYFLGSGFQYGLACEANLKMKEMSLSVSEAFHFMEFRHGPMSMVNSKTLVVGLLSDSASSYELAVLKEMQALGAQTLLLTDKVTTEVLPADYLVCFESGLPESSRAALYMPVLQLLAYYRALHNGQNPDVPTNLNAVVVL